jgi:hypothetical protein
LTSVPDVEVRLDRGFLLLLLALAGVLLALLDLHEAAAAGLGLYQLRRFMVLLLGMVSQFPELSSKQRQSTVHFVGFLRPALVLLGLQQFLLRFLTLDLMFEDGEQLGVLRVEILRLTSAYFSLFEFAESALVIEDNFQKEAVLDRFAVVEFGEPQQESRDEVVEYFVVVLLLAARCKTTVYRHRSL